MTPIIAPIDLTITDTESGGATLTFTPLGEPSATYHLTTDTVRVLVDTLAGVVVPLPGEVRVVVRVGREAEAPESWKSSTPVEALSALARTIGKTASVRRIDGGWCADIAGVEVKDTRTSMILDSAVAFAETRNGAAAKLVNKLRAGWLVIDAQNANRREMACPPIEAWAWGGVDRDVATDPRVGDRVTFRPSSLAYTADSIDAGRVLVSMYGRDKAESMWLSAAEWSEVCRTPGAKVERWEG